MRIVLKPVHPAQGAQWVRLAFQLFLRAPLSFLGLFGGFLFLALILMFIPVVGGLVVMAALPLLSLVMMMGSAAAERGKPVPAWLLIAPLRADPVRRQRLLSLCAAYGAATILVLGLSDWVDGGKLLELQTLMAQGAETEAEREAIQALLADGDLVQGMLIRFGLTGLLSLPFWYAPALVWWAQQGVAQSLFSSVVALWRSRLAFLIYLATWATVLGLGGAVLGMLLQALGAANVLGLLAMPIGLSISVVFYVSLYFMFTQTFGFGQPPEDTAEPINPPV